MKRKSREMAALVRLLDQALEMPEAQREDWVNSLEGEHSVLRDTLRNLLSQADAPESVSFLDLGSRIAGIVDAGLKLPDAELHAGAIIGPYRLERELGKGGMGSVWLAQRADGAFSRTVALKLPRMVWIDDVAARMARERDILASLQHEHIARFYDAGVDQAGRPYIAMEYVQGQPIDLYCRERALDVDEILKLIMQVCAALAHAHSRLIVHRDLKPGNILVSAEHGVRLLDFGIAALVSEDAAAPVTQFAGRMLTMDYSSPEQIRGDPIGTSSDIYSLAVVAYQLLTGQRPYDLGSGSIAQAAKAIVETEPRPASEAADGSRRGYLRGDLDAVLNKALKKDPAERYSSMSELADDIDRHLRHIPVRARPDHFAYRARKFLGRYRWQVGAAALVFCTMLIGGGVAMRQAYLAKAEAARADLVKDFALSIFEDADINASDNGAPTTAKNLLLLASKRAESELVTRPDVTVELMTSIAYSLIGQDEVDEGLQLSKRAVDRSIASLGREHPLTLAAMVVEGEALKDIGNPAEGEQVLGQVIEPAQRQKLTTTYVDALLWLSSVQLDLDKDDAALANARLAIASLPAKTDTPRLQRLAEDVWGNLANALLYLKLPGAVEPARRALELSEQLYAGHPNDELFMRRSFYGEALDADGQGAAAIPLLEQTLRDARQVLSAHNAGLEYIAWRLVTARTETGDLDGALEASRVALAVVTDDAKKGEDRSGASRYYMVRVLWLEHRDIEALTLLDLAIAALKQQSGADSPVSLRARSLRGVILARLNRLPEAEEEFSKLRDARLDAFDAAILGIEDAYLRTRQGQFEEAIALAQHSVTELRKTTAVTWTADAERVLGAALLAQGRIAAAQAALQDAVRLYQSRQQVPTPDHLDAVALLEHARTPVPAPSDHAKRQIPDRQS